jgi:hypothetical protein
MPSGSIKGGNFIGQLSDYRLVKKGPAQHVKLGGYSVTSHVSQLLVGFQFGQQMESKKLAL